MIEFLAQFFEFVDGKTSESDAVFVEPDIVQSEQIANPMPFEIAFSPQDCLQDDVLTYIFVLIAQDYGIVTFPLPMGQVPPQVVLSHVCSRWRVLALHTFELWNNIRLVSSCSNYVGRVPREWLLRTGSSIVFLTVDPINSTWDHDDTVGLLDDDDTAAHSIQETVAPFETKRLHLHLTVGHLIELSRLYGAVLPDIEKLRLDSIDEDVEKHFSDGAHFFTSLRSITFVDSHFTKDPGVSFARFPFPWIQLRCLELYLPYMNLGPIIDMLSQVPMLRGLTLVTMLRGTYPVAGFTMPYLRALHLEFGATKHLDKVLPIFTCPVLTDLTLYANARWTGETYNIIKRQYNIKGLEEIDFWGCSLPVSSILMDAPTMRVLSLSDDVIMDKDAFMGISNGTLGRHLREFRIDVRGITDRIIEMVETRKRLADELIENGRNWREVITVLKEVKIYGKCRPRHMARLEALKAAGITIIFLLYSV
ncbi:hypothetical protein APHAL10511_005668 [Amanita phalloides]|nr:hypothetical protein APHAL10511_005668 [Amanita phalloides]